MSDAAPKQGGHMRQPLTPPIAVAAPTVETAQSPLRKQAAAFHSDIYEHPDDRGLQDIYADWREEYRADAQFRDYLRLYRLWYDTEMGSEHLRNYPGGIPLLPNGLVYGDLRQQYHAREPEVVDGLPTLEWYHRLPKIAKTNAWRAAEALRAIVLREWGAQFLEAPLPSDQQWQQLSNRPRSWQINVISRAMRQLATFQGGKYRSRKRQTPYAWSQQEVYDAVQAARRQVLATETGLLGPTTATEPNE
jgi:hypothetical protein